MSRSSALRGKHARSSRVLGARCFAVTVSLVASIMAITAMAAAASTASAPAIENESASNITATDATLEAQINPGGLETSYEFRLETPECQLMAGPGPAVGCQVVGTGTIPGGSSTQTVSTDIAKAWQNLSPNSTYMFAVFASNSAGAAPGRHEEWFETASAPTIENESVSNITPTNATLEAEINLHEAPAGVYYQFQLVKEPSEYATEILCPTKPPQVSDFCIGTHSESALPIGFLPRNTLQPGATSHASLDLAGASVALQPNTTYHYRVLVARRVQTEDTIEWEPPTVSGADQIFTTPSEPPPPIFAPWGLGPANPRPICVHPRHHCKRDRHRHTSRSPRMVSYKEEQGGIAFRLTSVLVWANGRASVRFERCERRFQLKAGLWRKLSAALRQTDVHALAGDYGPATPRAEESTWLITVGHDTVRITGFSIPQELRMKLKALLRALSEVRSVGKRQMPASCAAKRINDHAG